MGVEDRIKWSGVYPIGLGNSDEVTLTVLKCIELDLVKQKLYTYISPKSRPSNVDVIQKENRPFCPE